MATNKQIQSTLDNWKQSSLVSSTMVGFPTTSPTNNSPPKSTNVIIINPPAPILNISDEKIIGIVHDESATNFRAIYNLKSVQLLQNAVEMSCWAHILSRTGKQLILPLLDQFLTSWHTLVCFSPFARSEFFSLSKRKCPYTTNFTRWHPTYEEASTTKLNEMLNDTETINNLYFQLCIIVDYGELIVKATYFLEGDGILLPFTYDILIELRNSFQKGNDIMPFTSKTIKMLSSKNGELNPSIASIWKKKLEETICPVRECLNERLRFKSIENNYDGKHLKEICQYNSFMISKVARLLNPSRFLDIDHNIDSLIEISNYVSIFTKSQCKQLWSELPKYKSLCQDYLVNEGEDKVKKLEEFFIRHQIEVPTWYSFFQYIALLQPTSGFIERVNSVFDRVIGPTQQNSTESTIEAHVILGYNYRDE